MLELKSLIPLIEQGQDMFYDHFEVGTQQNKIELQWIDQNWRYRLTPYSGEWIQIKNPLEINEINQDELYNKISYFLLVEYYCYLTKLRENDFRKKRIEKELGQEKCDLIVLEMKELKKALKEILKETYKNQKKKNLKLVQEKK